jgi:hypothetical protein
MKMDPFGSVSVIVVTTPKLRKIIIPDSEL